jgi:hypothetical protein
MDEKRFSGEKVDHSCCPLTRNGPLKQCRRKMRGLDQKGNPGDKFCEDGGSLIQKTM